MKKIKVDTTERFKQELIALEEKYIQIGNPVYALEAFLTARKEGLDIPIWVMDWLEKGLLKYYVSFGTENLGHLFGFNADVSGKTPSFKKIIIERRNRLLVLHTFILANCFDGITISKAAQMVEEAQDRYDYNINSVLSRYYERAKLHTLSAERIEKAYRNTSSWVDFLKTQIDFDLYPYHKTLFLSAFLPTTALKDDEAINILTPLIKKSFIDGLNRHNRAISGGILDEHVKAYVKGVCFQTSRMMQEKFTTPYLFHLNYFVPLALGFFKDPLKIHLL